MIANRFFKLRPRELPFQCLFACLTLIALLSAGCAGNRPADDIANYPYHRPLSSPGEKFSGLPPAVQSTVRAQAGSAQMYDILKTSQNGDVVYQVIFLDGNLFPPLYIASDGSVLYPESSAVAVGAGNDPIGALSGGAVSGLKLGDLPTKVTATLQEKAPTAEVAFINKITAAGGTLYEISFKNSAHPTLRISEDGMLVREP